ncbi:MAG TPA: hypothetical protein VNJ53_06310 [Gaiellaceae bacterium]|nr:hypothetical protein [Gaiellaceae bacterium]
MLLADLLGTPVRVRDLRVGEVGGVLLDETASTVIGLEVACTDGTARVLPWAVASFEEGCVRAPSALVLVDAGDGYLRLGAVALHERAELAPLVVAPDGRLLGAPVSPALSAGTARS